MANLAAALRQHERVGVDTPIVISHIEGTAPLAGVAMAALAGGAFTGVTSVLTLMEVAVKPLQMGRPDVAEEYEILLANYPNLVIAAIDRPTVRRAAELRAEYRLRPADACRSSHGSSSTTCPRYITTTRSQKCSITFRS